MARIYKFKSASIAFFDPCKSVLSAVRFWYGKRNLSSGGIVFRAVIHSGVGLSFGSLVGTGSGRAFFLGCRLRYAQSDIGQFQKTAAVGRATRTVFPGALSRRALQAISRRYPEVFGDLRLLV